MAYEHIITDRDYAPGEKTAAMTQPVGKDADGKLWTAPGGGGGTSDHRQLTNRAAADQHPMSAITGLAAALDGKQSSISDLETIRAGAGKGETAVQPSAIADMASKTWVAAQGFITSLAGYATQAWVQAQGYLTEHQSLAGYATQAWVEAKGYITSLAGYATEAWVEAKGYLTEHQSLTAYRTSAAQDVIDDAQDTAIGGKYTKPTSGIPKTDLATAVQTSLGLADSALQEHQSLAAYRTSAAQDVIDAGKVSTADYDPDAKTAAMTQAVGKDAQGKLWTAPGGGGTDKTLLYHFEMTDDKYDYIIPLDGYDSATGEWETDGSVDLTTIPNGIHGTMCCIIPTSITQYILNNRNSFTITVNSSVVAATPAAWKELPNIRIDSTHFKDSSWELPDGHDAGEYALYILIPTGDYFKEFETVKIPKVHVAREVLGNYDNYEIEIKSSFDTRFNNSEAGVLGPFQNGYAGDFISIYSKCQAYADFGSPIRNETHINLHREPGTVNDYWGTGTCIRLHTGKHGYIPAVTPKVQFIQGFWSALPWKDAQDEYVKILCNRTDNYAWPGSSIKIWGWNNGY